MTGRFVGEDVYFSAPTPGAWCWQLLSNRPHTHNPLDDAVEPTCSPT